MALNLEYSIVTNNVDGESCFFTDITTNYGSPNIAISDIRIVRLYRGNYIDDVNVITLSGSGTMAQWREYQSQTLSPFVYDSKIVPLMGRFIPFIAGITVQTASTMQTTGRYSPYIAPATYLPLVTKNTLVLTPADFGLTDTVFPDRVYYCSYQIFIDGTATTNVVQGVTYIVYSGNCVYAGSTYRTGEVFIAVDNGALSGTFVLKQIAGDRFKYFIFSYNIDKNISDLTVQALGSCRYEEIAFEMSVIKDKLDGLKFANIQDNTSAMLAQNTISDITRQLAVLTTNFNA